MDSGRWTFNKLLSKYLLATSLKLFLDIIAFALSPNSFAHPKAYTSEPCLSLISFRLV